MDEAISSAFASARSSLADLKSATPLLLKSVSESGSLIFGRIH